MKNQTELLKDVLNKFKFKSDAQKAISDGLGVSIYKAKDWMNGKRPMKYQDIQEFVKVFDVTRVDVFPFGSGEMAVEPIGIQVDDMDECVQELKKLVNYLECCGDDPDGRVCVVADKIPMLHLMAYPDLVYIKWFIYIELLGVNRSATFEEYVEEMDSLGISELFDRIRTVYSRIASVEIWDDFALYDYLQKLSYMYSSISSEQRGRFEYLLEQLERLVSELKQTIEDGTKAGGGTLSFYRNQMRNSCSYVRIDYATEQRVLMQSGNVHQLLSNEPYFKEKSKDWMKVALHSSIAMGVGAKRELALYFQNLLNEISNVKKEWKAYRKQKK